jgi:hypothetical protein
MSREHSKREATDFPFHTIDNAAIIIQREFDWASSDRSLVLRRGRQEEENHDS